MAAGGLLDGLYKRLRILIAVAYIFICPEKGKPMQAMMTVQAIAGVGLAGDRYSTGNGSYSQSMNKRIQVEHLNVHKPIREVTLMSLPALHEANQSLCIPFSAGETRRNLFLDNLSAADLLSFIDKQFTIGDVEMRGFEECEPCLLPGNMASKTGFKQAFARCGGLRAQILSSGTIAVGDELRTAV
jgi:hypothetical protein